MEASGCPRRSRIRHSGCRFAAPRRQDDCQSQNGGSFGKCRNPRTFGPGGLVCLAKSAERVVCGFVAGHRSVGVAVIVQLMSGSKNRVIVLAVVEGGLTVAEAAERFGVSPRWVHVLVARYRAEGLDGLEPRSRRPHRSPTRIPDEVCIKTWLFVMHWPPRVLMLVANRSGIASQPTHRRRRLRRSGGSSKAMIVSPHSHRNGRVRHGGVSKLLHRTRRGNSMSPTGVSRMTLRSR